MIRIIAPTARLACVVLFGCSLVFAKSTLTSDEAAALVRQGKALEAQKKYAEAAVVYTRHWQQFGDTYSRDAAYGLLRTITYMQTLTNDARRGNFVLWMEPNGTLNPSAIPTESPDPSDSGQSYWLARSIWALGEGYAAFQHADPSFAQFLQDRLTLARQAVDREALARYGTGAARASSTAPGCPPG